MPGIEHEAAVELFRRDPELAVTLLASAGVPVSATAVAVVADSNLSVPAPTELRADVVTLHRSPGGKLAIVTEIQKNPPDTSKRRAWPAYVAVAQAEHQCDAVLLVIALRPGTARAAARPIRTGHPGFVLTPVVIGPANTPAAEGADPVPAAELTVLAVLTGALNLSDAEARLTALRRIAKVDAPRREAYTRLIRSTASPAVREALEELMTTVFKDDFIDGILSQGRAEGRAEGEARMLLRVLAARGFDVPARTRQAVRSCTDIAQLEAWADRAVVAASLDDIFGE